MGLELLRLFQLVSPALPVGAFSYSEGLEVLVQSGRLADAAAVRAWLEAELERGLVAIEAAQLPELMRRLAAGELDAAAERDGWLLAQREAAELRAQQRQMGRSLLQLLTDLGWPLPRPLALGWTGAWAWAGVCLELPPQAVLEAYLHGWTANQLSAAVRLVPLGPTQAQRLQLALAPLIAARAAALYGACQAGADPIADGLWSSGVGAGLAQLRHAELYSRLFRS
ncbi:urease accessory protein UreF [Cyanobium sp. CH-040]|uniref:urease accessory protein UreF n=1 Tax=Cyanobium sp. CH-040 TaxID=2823708 RepID=UPI0020CF376B|nr:urease accessory UreF family protein [Cyanobium sp. CH-040]MCP9928395.1 urease accessory protein UreF [Cyanobium sp. CH-040]